MGYNILLTREQEKQLKIELEHHWSYDGYDAVKCAEMLGFGTLGPYQHLEMKHVHYFVKKFKLPRHVPDHYAEYERDQQETVRLGNESVR